MSGRVLQTLLEGGSFFESPRWHEGRWWVSDFYSERVLAVDTDGRDEEVMSVEGQPSGLGWMPDGSMLVVSMRDHRILRRSPDGDGDACTPTSASYCGGQLNDMVVDGQRPRVRGELRLRPDGRRRPGAGGADPRRPGRDAPRSPPSDLLFPNGSVITPDGADADRRRDGRRPLHGVHDRATTASLTDRRIWAQVAPTPRAHHARRDAGRAAVRPGRLRARRRGPHLGGRRGRRALRAPRSRRRDRRRDRARPKASTSSPACSAATTAARCSCAPRPTSARRPQRRRTRRSCSPPRSTSRTPGCRSRHAAHGVTVLSESAPSLRPTL